MDISACHLQHQQAVESAMGEAFATIADNIESDPDFTLSGDEITEMEYEFMNIYIKT
jgi:hypothetical protein